MLSIYDENNKIRDCYKLSPSAITPDLPITDSLIMEDEHLDTIPVTESANTIKSSVDDLVPTPSESADLSDGESECDVPINDDSPESHFTTFSNPLFDSNDDFSSDDESLSEEEIQKDEFKYFSNPLYDLDDEIITNEKFLPNQKDLDVVIPIPPGIDERCFNAESDLLESLQNREIPIDSTKIDSIFDEFSLPRPPEILSFSQDVMDLVFYDSIPPSIDDDDDSEGDILPLEELLDNVLFLLPKSDNFTFIEPVATMENIIEELNEDESFDPEGGVNVVLPNVEEDDTFTLTIRTFLPFVTYPKDSPLLLPSGSEDTIFDPGISIFHFSSLKPVAYENPMVIFLIFYFCPMDKGIRGEIPQDHEDPCSFSILQSSGLRSFAYFGILNPNHEYYCARYRLTSQRRVRGGRTRQYEVLFRWRLDQSERDTWHWRVSVRGVRVSVRGQACMDPCQSLAIMSRGGVQIDYNTPQTKQYDGGVLERMRLPLPLGAYIKEFTAPAVEGRI
ncbi:hypothetical protein Tco_0485185 [Tanacetum coccineum]